MHRKVKIPAATLLAAFFLMLPALSSAKVYIDISSAKVQRVPVAVPEPKVTGRVPDTARRVTPEMELAKQLRSDLAFVGIFEVLDPKGYLEDPEVADLVPDTNSFADWRSIGAELLIKSQLDYDAGQYIVDLYAYDAVRQDFLFGKRFRGSSDSMKDISGLFANAALEKFTGKEGPFGTQIAYAVKEGAGKEIYRTVLNRPSTTAKVTNTKALNLGPVWGRGLDYIYVTSYYGGEPELCRVFLDEGFLRYVRRNDGMDMPGEEAPSGKTLAYASSVGGNTDIYLLDLDSGKQRRLTSDRAIDVSPAWSPDGEKLAFVSDRKGNPHIFTVDKDGDNLKRITFSGKHNGDPAWSPDGDQIAFTGMDKAGTFQVFIVDVEGRKMTQITHGPYDTLEPSWSPDGRFLAVTSKKDGEKAVYVLRLGANQMERVSPEGKDASQPAWSYRRPK
ncbi:MAG: hypothetical protein C0609_09255 [Deltaproteobacteria bacterium]|nr:MAG: hypothetical protein C0609_09255 [Deltaproteobacteria bacterium]